MIICILVLIEYVVFYYEINGIFWVFIIDKYYFLVVCWNFSIYVNIVYCFGLEVMIFVFFMLECVLCNFCLIGGIEVLSCEVNIF